MDSSPSKIGQSNGQQPYLHQTDWPTQNLSIKNNDNWGFKYITPTQMYNLKVELLNNINICILNEK